MSHTGGTFPKTGPDTTVFRLGNRSHLANRVQKRDQKKRRVAIPRPSDRSDFDEHGPTREHYGARSPSTGRVGASGSWMPRRLIFRNKVDLWIPSSLAVARRFQSFRSRAARIAAR